MKKSQPPTIFRRKMVGGQAVKRPYRVKKKKSILKNRFFRLVILFLILGISVFYLLIFSSVFQVKKIIATGENRVSGEAIEFVVQREAEKKLLFFSTKSIFLINSQKIKESILNNFPALADIEVHRRFPDSLNIVVIERLAKANWCREERCFLLNAEGVIFEEITATGTNLLKIKTSDFDGLLRLGDRVIEKERLEQIFKITSELKERLKIAIDFVEIFSKENRLNVKTGEGWEIYFNLEGDIDWQITELDLLLENKIPPEKRESLEYIDLRFSRIYYKYK